MFKFWSLDRQLEQAKVVFELAKRKSPFYSIKLKNVDKISSYEDWQRIGFLTRDEVYNNSYPNSMDMFTQPLEDMIIVSTGGSSGIARFTALKHSEWDVFCDVQAKALMNLGVTRKDIVANLFVAGSLWPSFLGGHEIIKRIGAVHLPISALSDIEKLVYFLEKFKPTVILSLPTMFVFIADELLKKNKKLESVRMIQYAGEHLSKNIRTHIKNAFGDIEIRSSGYTSADCGLMGYQCKHCKPNEYHIPTDFQFIEIYDFERNRTAKRGELGELIVTNLKRLSFPIIRYRIGDVGYIKNEPCACGDKNPILVLEGRAGEDFKLGGAYYTMSEIEKALEPFVSKSGLSVNYQVVIEDIKPNKMSFVLRIESSDIKNSAKLKDAIKDSLKEQMDALKVGEKIGYIEQFDIEFAELGSLPRSPITGKVKRLLDKRVKED